MTQTQELPAGRELDALVSEKVFGRMIFRPQGVPATWEMADPDMRENDYEGYFLQVPHYSTDTAAARQVVEYLAKQGHVVSIFSPPLAICRAALAAVEAHP